MARHHRAHHRALFNREWISPIVSCRHSRVFSGPSWVPIARDAPVGTRFSPGRRQFLWEIFASPCNGSTPELSWCVNWFTWPLAFARSLALPSRPPPHKNPMTRAYPFHVMRDDTCTEHIYPSVNFRRINSTTRRLSDSLKLTAELQCGGERASCG